MLFILWLILAVLVLLTALLGQLESTAGEILAALQRLLPLLPALPVRFSITVVNSKGETMGQAKGKVKLTFLDDGSALATLGLLDTAGLPATLPAGSSFGTIPWVSSDPGLVVTPAADGLSAKLTPSTPPVLVTGAVVTAGPAVLTNVDASNVNFAAVSTEALNIVGGGPTGFKISVA